MNTTAMFNFLPDWEKISLMIQKKKFNDSKNNIQTIQKPHLLFLGEGGGCLTASMKRLNAHSLKTEIPSSLWNLYRDSHNRMPGSKYRDADANYRFMYKNKG